MQSVTKGETRKTGILQEYALGYSGTRFLSPCPSPYRVNGKVGKFNKTDEENIVFERNMIDLKQTSTIKIEAEIPTIDLTRHNVLTGGVMYSNGKTSPAVGYTGSMGKVGTYQVVGSKDSQYVGFGIKF